MKSQIPEKKLFLQFFKNFFFWEFFRAIKSILKIITRKITGYSEIERRALNNDFEGFYQTINRSKGLKAISKYYETEIHDSASLNPEILNTICRIKKISKTSDSIIPLENMLIRLFNLIKNKQILEERRKLQFDYNNKEQVNKLLQLWDTLKPSEKLTDICTRQWIDIGFQCDNPATDFRGGGYLALENLVFFAINHPTAARYCLTVSNSPTHQYFFCCAGIYITLELWRWTKDRELDILFQYTNPLDQSLYVFNEIYCRIFEYFNDYWVNHPQANMMNFNNLIIEFFKIKKKEIVTKMKNHFLPLLKQENLKSNINSSNAH